MDGKAGTKTAQEPRADVGESGSRTGQEHRSKIGASGARAAGPETGADLLVRTIADEADVIFGYPGGAVLPIYDAIYRQHVRHVLARHEQGAIHAAEGYARVSGKPGVVIATSGPGATNLVTGLMDALIDSLPLVVFTGQVATHLIGTNAFQEADVMNVTAPVTKHNFQVAASGELVRTVREAFYIASSGRPGPVLIDLPKDLCASPASGAAGPTDMELPGYRIPGPPGPRQMEKLIEAMKGAEKPLILSGAGVLHAGAAEPLIRFAERQQIPVVTTLLGLGSFPATHPLFFGMGGMHGTYAANMAISECDLLVNIGSRFDDRLTGALDRFAPNAVVAHVDIDPVELGKNVRPNIPILGDAALVLDQLNKRAETKKTPDTSGWIDHLRDYAGAHPLPNPRHRRTLTPQAVIKQVARIVGDEAIVTTDVGQHQMWAAQYYPFTRPNQWVTSGGLGTMGFGFPAAIGAQVAEPEKTVVAIVGDGGFQMTSEELAVVAEEQLPVKVVIVNNQVLGMVHQWQDAFYEKRYAQSNVSVQPDFVRLAESYGIRGARVTSEEEAEQTLPRLLADRRPAVIDCRISPDEIVLPMVPPGAGLSEMTGV